MIAVMFEGWPDAGQGKRYLDIAASLKPLLEHVPGFISIERFESLAEPGKLLSLSFWESEAAVAAWRNMAAHRVAQAEGRTRTFRDYRLRIAAVFRDYGIENRAEAPADSVAVHG
jgi:heme-degrading monooxygenase HmoA